MNWIVYSHTDYLDILNIQTFYLKDITNKKLLINGNGDIPQDIKNSYQEILYYDDSLPYASRILSLKDRGIKDDYFLLTHDIDILISKDKDILEKLLLFAKENNLDRIDLQYYNTSGGEFHFDWPGYDFELIRQNNPHHYIYNVNPSIWKFETLIDIMSNFPNENYRTIEKFETQVYCQKYRIYKMFYQKPVECGYFRCLPFYQFLHISHGGGLLPLRENGLEDNLHVEYMKICSNFKFNPNRHFRISRW